ncbi:MAG TPA: Pr6Pr family membrane protein [Stackebrandtia sp.]|uniref:Pr6Pr family membrane protein n=1 Tax=Stackebrandtia sp. TaxID=2023065 RepID=UPI002D70F1CD|nr:Pr6Pr family membrane protein [Stackebrandtia sp.]HZE40104.1 Pr6Pr family membrane protein [Stackebrandtia sp.]
MRGTGDNARRWVVAGYRMAFGALTLATFVYNIVVVRERPQFNMVNMLSYFTIESNLFAGGVFVAAALLLGGGRVMDAFRGAATVYLVTTGVVYLTLLSGYEGIEALTPPLVNLVMHQIMPVVLVVDWLLDPARARLSYRDCLWWLLFPIVYLGYTLLRGHATGWYPYPFLDPAHSGGYGAVAAACAAVAAFVVAVNLAVVWYSNRRQPADDSDWERMSSDCSTESTAAGS